MPSKVWEEITHPFPNSQWNSYEDQVLVDEVYYSEICL